MKTFMNKKVKLNVLSMMVAAATAGFSASASADLGGEITAALTGGKAYGDFRLRYEMVDQDNALKDADALTLRSRLGYKTGDVHGVSAGIEFEDSRVVGGTDTYEEFPFANPKTHSVIADPETTEIDQMFVQFKNELIETKLGRQVIALDNQRYIGHVGWRQDRQVFDASSLKFTPIDDLTAQYVYISKRNRVFAEAADINSKDHLINVGYKTPFGKLTGYAYLLEEDNATEKSYDTYGLSFSGKKEVNSDLKALYAAEYATQDFENGAAEADADYMNLELGAVFKGVTAKFGYEVLGSDDSAYAFSTPLATGHKFNGWSDQFLATPPQGLVDMSFTVTGKVAGIKLLAKYHQFDADDAASGQADELGNELNLLAAKKFSDNYSAGVKYAMYDAKEYKVDTQKAWLWVSAKF